MLKHIWNKLIEYFYNMKLKRKLLVAFFSLIIIPLGIFTIISNERVSNAIESLVKYSSIHSFEQAEAFLSYKIKKMYDVSNVITTDKKTVEILSKSLYATDLIDQFINQLDLSMYLTSFQNDDEIFKVNLYVNDSCFYANENKNIYGFAKLETSNWYNSFIKNRKNVLWIISSEDEGVSANINNIEPAIIKKVSLIRSIINPNDYSKIIGLLKIDILESNIRDILNKASPTKNSFTYITNSKNEIISSSYENLKPEWIFDYNSFDNKVKNSEAFSSIYKINSQKILLTCKHIQYTDWIILSVVPYNDILAVSTNIKFQMVFLFLALGTISYFIAYLISKSITKRIHFLIEKMKKIKDGDFNIKIEAMGKDEIGELMCNFNDMAEKISYLIKEQYRIGQEAKNSELMALQSQINPHFLYNTMDLISWIAINNNVPEIASIVKSLSKFYKLSLNKGANIVPIRDEIEHVKLYVDLQNRRFNNNITLQIEAEEEIYNYTIPKIILQPIVENSIMHGIFKRKDKKGIIKLTGRLQNGCIVFIIYDNGIGMSKEKLSQILSDSKSESLNGYGIKNINERIKINYGEEYGMIYNSVINEGTTVTITIPAIKDNFEK